MIGSSAARTVASGDRAMIMTAAISPRPARLMLFAIASWYTGRWELSRIWEAIAISFQQSVRAKEVFEQSTLAPELKAECRQLQESPLRLFPVIC